MKLFKRKNRIKRVKPSWRKQVFISFIEEYWPGQREGSIMGRVEVSRRDDHYPSEEIRFFTFKQDEFYKFRDRWDFKYISEKKLNKLREIIEERFKEYGISP